MAGCACGTNVRFEGVSRRYRRVLLAVIGINALMFVVEMTAGALADSQALKADALDFLGDTLTYGLSLWAIGRPLSVRAGAALVKGASLGLMGLWVLGATLWQVLSTDVPVAPVMGAVGALACAANIASVLLLLRYREGDSNVRSVWLCSRNDAVGNLAVVVAAGAVVLTGSAWPDLLVAAAMAGLFLWSSAQIVTQALVERVEARGEAQAPG
ncbi:MAG: cation transporter [Paracoccaceae bacterium]|jgi:Co/Zn/Cd efflux system component|nr:cation transporter [Paracoccaceae bacterium]